MDYKVQKWMNNFSFLSKQSFPRLSSTPAKTFVDPGLARIAPLYQLYVPITAKKGSTHEITKKIDDTNSVPMTGTGLIQPEPQPPKVEDESKKLSDGVLYSFLHPKIETDKIVFETKSKNVKDKNLKRSANKQVKDITEVKKPKIEKKMLHKFSFFD